MWAAPKTVENTWETMARLWLWAGYPWFTWHIACVAEPSQISVDTRGRVNTDSSPKSEEILAQLSGDPDGADLAGSVKLKEGRLMLPPSDHGH